MPIPWDCKAAIELRKEIVRSIVEAMETEEELKKDVIDYIPSERYSRMYRLVYGDGSISKDFYNKTRAKEFLRLDLQTQKARKIQGIPHD